MYTVPDLQGKKFTNWKEKKGKSYKKKITDLWEEKKQQKKTKVSWYWLQGSHDPDG